MNSKKESLALIILAAGSSSRMGTSTKKEYLPLNNGTVLSECVRAFLKAEDFSSIIITVPKNNKEKAQDSLFKDDFVKNALKEKTLHFIEGGESRQESVYNALQFLNQNIFPDYVLIHDGARPFVTEQIIKETVDATKKYGAAAPGITPVDTQKKIDSDNFITEHLCRPKMCAIQTPQGFSFAELFAAHQKAHSDKKEYTDDTEIWTEYTSSPKKVKIVKGSELNKKITFKEDYKTQEQNKIPLIRTGLGYDIHRLVSGRRLIIGGIEFDFEKGEDGHSDGDALFHAITDALLGASALGDIGSFFPPEEEKWKNADSSELLKTVWKKIKQEGWSLINLDCVVKLEKPKFLPKRTLVIENIAKTLNVEPERIFVKAKTGEKLDSVGQSNAIEAFCTCLLQKSAN